MKQLVFYLATFTLCVPGFSQNSFSLKEAIQYTLKNHGTNVIYNNQVEKERIKLKETMSGYLPQVNANLTLDDNLKRQTTVLPGAMFGQSKDILVQFGNKYNTGAVVQLDQTIYDQSLLYAIKTGAPSQKIASLNLAKNNEDLIYNTAAAFSQILILKRKQELITENEKQYEELNTIAKFRFEKGVAKKVDLDRVTVQLNNIQAQQKQIQADINGAYNSLKNAMGLPLDSSIQIEDSRNYNKFLDTANTTLDVAVLIDYQLQAQNIMLQEFDVKRKQAAYLPTVSMYARYGQQAFGNDLGKATTNWNDYSAVGLKMSIPIFSGRKRESQVQQSKIELQNAKENLELTTAQLQLQFQNANLQLQENITTLATNKNNMELAKSVFGTSQFEYSKGVSSMSDLLNADFSYKQAQSNYLTSLLNVVANRLEYERAKGTITNFINQL